MRRARGAASTAHGFTYVEPRQRTQERRSGALPAAAPRHAPIAVYATDGGDGELISALLERADRFDFMEVAPCPFL